MKKKLRQGLEVKHKDVKDILFTVCEFNKETGGVVIEFNSKKVSSNISKLIY